MFMAKAKVSFTDNDPAISDFDEVRGRMATSMNILPRDVRQDRVNAVSEERDKWMDGVRVAGRHQGECCSLSSSAHLYGSESAPPSPL